MELGEFSVGMEELTRGCDNLSLLVREDKKATSSKKHHVLKFELAAKFYTKIALSMDAMVHTFRPLWCTKGNFHITNVGNNILPFAFELEVDAEKVLLGEPPSYDRHLVISKRFNGSRPLKEVEFKHYSFWVQIHDIPFKFMTSETALEIGETVESVMVPQDRSEMEEGTFMCVRVKIDVTRPLCRGRRVAFEDALEGYVAFQYERLPNICFQCEMLSHDKECELWLKSKGAFSVDQQQFGHWIRASSFSPGRIRLLK